MNFLHQLRSFFRRSKLDAEMREEMRAHIEEQTHRNIAAGMDATEARYAAERTFGNVSSLQERAREARGWVWLEQVWRDLRHGLRAVRRSPGFAATVVATLAIGIGVNLAIFSLINAVLLRPLHGVRDADSLVVIGHKSRQVDFGNTSFPVFREYRAGSASVFTGLAAYATAQFSLASGERTDLVLGELVSANYFDTAGVRMAAGRGFLPHEDEVAGRDPVVVISHRMWLDRWQGDPGVVGRTITLNGHAFTVVGVAEAGFKALQLPTAYDLWVPLHMRGVLMRSESDPFSDSDFRWLRRMVGRLAPGVTPQQAAEHLAGLARSLQPVPAGGEPLAWTHRVVRYSPFPVPDRGGPIAFFSILCAITGLVLGAATLNASSLFLSRALARQRDVAVRLAVGASRGRLIRQMVVEGLILASIAAIVGVAGSHFAADWIVANIPGENDGPAALDLAVDWRLAAVGVVLTFMTALGVGLLPAWQASKVEVLTALKCGETSPARGRFRLRSLLVVAQVALSVVLLVCASLVFRSLWLLEETDPTRDAAATLMVRVDPRLNGYDETRGRQYYLGALERIRALPGVRRAMFAAVAPFADESESLGPVHGGVLEAASAVRPNVNSVTPGFFGTVGPPLLRGRDFGPQDTAGAPRVAIVNEALAGELWPGADPIGQYLQAQESETPLLVIGLVAQPAGSQPLPREVRLGMFVPFEQRKIGAASALVLTDGNPADLLPSVRAALRELDPNVPLFQVTTLQAARDRTLWQQRIVGALVSFCSASAVLLAMVGLYSALAQDVAKRTREIGIRIAIGADTRDVRSLVLGQGMRLALPGLCLGIALAAGVTRLLQSVLVGVSPHDPLTFAAVPVVLAAIAVVACLLPARRAAKVDPIIALRAE